MSSTADLLVGFSSDSAAFEFDGRQVQITFGPRSGLTEFNYLDSTGDVGALSDFGALLDRYHELGGDDEFIRGGFEFTEHSSGERRAFVSQITEIDVIGDTRHGGHLVLKGTLLDPIEDGGTEDTDEIVGERFQYLHNKGMDEAHHLDWFWGGVAYAGDVESHLDTFSVDEFQEFNPGDSLIQTHSSSHDLKPQQFYVPSTALRAFSDEADRLGGQASVELINFTKAWSQGGVEAGVSLKATPSVSMNLDFPDHWWQYLFPSEYRFNSDLKLNWSADVHVKSDSVKSGNITFLNTTIDGPGKTFYPGPFDITLATSADLSAAASLSGVEGTYAFDASQQLGVSLSFAPGGSVDFQNISQSVKTSKTVPNVSDVDLGFTASVAPKVGLKVGYSIPEESPVWSGKSIATINGTIATPVVFDVDLSQGNGLSGVVGVKGQLNSDIKVLEFWDGGWTFDLGGTTFMDLKSENIFA